MNGKQMTDNNGCPLDEDPSYWQPMSGVYAWCGEWKQNTEGRTKENRYGLDGYNNSNTVVSQSATSQSAKPRRETCTMDYDNEYISNYHDRYWCSECNKYTDVEKHELPNHCIHCGREATVYCVAGKRLPK